MGDGNREGTEHGRLEEGHGCSVLSHELADGRDLLEAEPRAPLLLRNGGTEQAGQPMGPRAIFMFTLVQWFT